MKIGICSGFIAATVLLTGAAWASVSVDYDHHVDFARFKTYSWGTVQAVDQIWTGRVKDAVESQLASKGLTQLPSGGDVVVSAVVVTRPEQSFEGVFSGLPNHPWGFGGFSGLGRATINRRTYEVGSLVVAMFDGTSNALVLRAVATDTVSSKPERNRKKLDSEVRNMFKNFPPGSNGR